jgi:hypothetical protein
MRCGAAHQGCRVGTNGADSESYGNLVTRNSGTDSEHYYYLIVYAEYQCLEWHWNLAARAGGSAIGHSALGSRGALGSSCI